MHRTVVLSLVVLLLVAPAVWASSAGANLGVGATVGMMQPSGGDNEYEESGLIAGVQISKPLSDKLWVSFDYRHGVTENAELNFASPGSTRFSTWGVPEEFRTLWNHAEVSALWKFMPQESFTPFLSAGFGFTFWEVEDWRDEAVDIGHTPEGYDIDGRRSDLKGTNVTAALGAGFEFFPVESWALTVGGKFRYLLDSDIDNVGWSAVYGPNHVDANEYTLEGYVGLSYFFGAGDCDGDGIFGKADKCWRDPEDFDGFEDEDGCPDVDNDGDGILDDLDKCPNEAEDFDGEEDEDGCPDVDMDMDGIPDDEDACPEVPEDRDGYMDDDGCPDPDNDGDGVGDAMDECPDTPRGIVVMVNGCPKPMAELVAVMVFFDLNSDELLDTETPKLDALSDLMIEEQEIVVEVAGHACDLGTDQWNEELSEARAVIVADYLMRRGVEGGRISTISYGEALPLVPNDTEEARKQNRRVMVSPTRR